MSFSRSRVTPEKAAPGARQNSRRFREFSSASMFARTRSKTPRGREGSRVEADLCPELVAPQILPGREDGFGVGVESDGDAGAQRCGGQGEDARARTDVEHRTTLDGLFLEREEGEARRSMLASAECARRRHPQRDAPLRRLGVARIAGIDPESPPHGESARGGPEGFERIPFRDVGRQGVPDPARP